MNNEKPESNCNGNCYLTGQMDENQEKGPSPVNFYLNTDFDYITIDSEVSLNLFNVYERLNFSKAKQQNKLCSGYYLTISPPPKT